jgi:hypothetical protein
MKGVSKNFQEVTYAIFSFRLADNLSSAEITNPGPIFQLASNLISVHSSGTGRADFVFVLPSIEELGC